MGEKVARGRLLSAVVFWFSVIGAIVLLGALVWVPRYMDLCGLRRRAQATADETALLARRLEKLDREAHALRTDPFTVESAMRRELRLSPPGEEVVQIGASRDDRSSALPRSVRSTFPLEPFLRPFAFDPFFRVTTFLLACAMLLCAFAATGVGRRLKPAEAPGV